MAQPHSFDRQEQGGPGASHRDATDGKPERKRSYAETGQEKQNGQRNPSHSQVSGGGGELDSHHTHDPKTKS